MNVSQMTKAQKLCEMVRAIMNGRDEAAIEELEKTVTRLASQSQQTFADEVKGKTVAKV